MYYYEQALLFKLAYLNRVEGVLTRITEWARENLSYPDWKLESPLTKTTDYHY